MGALGRTKRERNTSKFLKINLFNTLELIYILCHRRHKYCLVNDDKKKKSGEMNSNMTVLTIKCTSNYHL